MPLTARSIKETIRQTYQSSQGRPTKTIPKITRKPSEFSQKLIWLDGCPLNLSGRPYLEPSYDYGYRNVIFKTGRQVEKSSTLRHIMLTRSMVLPHHRSLYVSPSQIQTGDFAKELSKLIDTSPPIRGNFFSTKLVNQTLERHFTNGSQIKLRYAYHHADRCRGISAKDVYIDEIQDFVIDNIPVIEECQSHYQDVARRCYSGTPKSFNNPIEVYWSDSTQCEWAIRCPGCNVDNIIDTHNIGKTGVICSKCGKYLDVREGRWVAMRPGALFHGFRISQLMVPFSNWEKILEKYDRYSDAKFHNEVLGLSFDSAEVPITLPEMLAASNSKFTMMDSKRGILSSHPIFMGIDWGTSEDSKSKTVISVGYFPRPDVFQYVYFKKFGEKEKDPQYQIQEIERIIGRFKVAVVGVDYGFGHFQNRLLMKSLGPKRVAVIYYAPNQKKPSMYNPKAHMFTINKSRYMSGMFSGVKRGQIRFPKRSDMEREDIYEDWLNIYIEYDERTRTMKYDHRHGYPDDAFHAALYCRFAGLVHFGRHKTD